MWREYPHSIDGVEESSNFWSRDLNNFENTLIARSNYFAKLKTAMERDIFIYQCFFGHFTIHVVRKNHDNHAEEHFKLEPTENLHWRVKIIRQPVAADVAFTPKKRGLQTPFNGYDDSDFKCNIL